MEIVRRTLSWANQPALTEPQMAQRAMDWQDAFEGIIPMDRLTDALSAARKAHTGSFPINAYEVLDAWKGIKPAPMTEWEWQKYIQENNRPREGSNE